MDHCKAQVYHIPQPISQFDNSNFDKMIKIKKHDESYLFYYLNWPTLNPLNNGFVSSRVNFLIVSAIFENLIFSTENPS